MTLRNIQYNFYEAVIILYIYENARLFSSDYQDCEDN